MAREEKHFRLRPVDEGEPAEEESVIRLEHGDGPVPTLQPAGRTHRGPTPSIDEPSHRLAIPDKDEVETRTHQPSVESILATAESQEEAMESNWGGRVSHRSPVPWGWFVLIGAGLVCAVIWGLTTMREGGEQIREIRTETAEHFVEEAEKDREAADMIGRIETAIRSMFAAADPGEMAGWVRQPERVLPLIREYRARSREKPAALEQILSLQPITLERRADFWTARVRLTDGSIRNLLLEVPDSGRARIDWETLVCHQPMPWDEFALERPEGRSLDFRVQVQPDLLYSHEFTDSEKWNCLRLEARDSEEILFGYVRTDTPAGRELVRLIEAEQGRPVSLILRLSVPPGLTSPRGVVIEKVLSRHWVYLDPPGEPTP